MEIGNGMQGNEHGFPGAFNPIEKSDGRIGMRPPVQRYVDEDIRVQQHHRYFFANAS